MLPAIWNGKSSYFHLYVAVLKELNFGCGAFLWMMCHYPNELVSGSFQRNAPVNFFLCNLSPAFTLKNKTPRFAPYLISQTVFWCSEARLSMDSATRAQSRSLSQTGRDWERWEGDQRTRCLKTPLYDALLKENNENHARWHKVGTKIPEKKPLYLGPKVIRILFVCWRVLS